MVSDVLSSPVAALPVLSLKYSQIDDVCANALLTGLAHINRLDNLNLSSLEVITASGWITNFSSLVSSCLPMI